MVRAHYEMLFLLPFDVLAEYESGIERRMNCIPLLFQDCTICMERLVMLSGYEGILQHKGIKPELVGKLGKCGHMYHLLCLVAMYNNGNKVGKNLQARHCYDVALSSKSKVAMSYSLKCKVLADDHASILLDTDGDLKLPYAMSQSRLDEKLISILLSSFHLICTCSS